MSLFASYLQKEVDEMESNGVCLKIVGDKSKFSPELQDLIFRAEEQTQHNTKITLRVAANYGGRWDFVQAAQSWQRANSGASIDQLTEAELAPFLSTAGAPEMDLPNRLINNKRPYRIEDMWIRSGNTSQNQYYTFECHQRRRTRRIITKLAMIKNIESAKATLKLLKR
jgi:undecaprenyl diphosphate synthase